MFSKISVLIPTRKRVERLGTVLDSFERTVINLSMAELVFRVDDDDILTMVYLTGQKFWRHCSIRIVVGPRFLGYDSMPVFFNELAQAATGDVLMCGNDDMVFQTSAWPERLLAKANHFPDGLFDLGVQTHNEEHFPFSIISRRAVERMGYLWDPTIFWGDIFLRDVMKWFDRAIMVPDVTIEHAWAGNQPDAVFLEADKDIVRRNPAYWTNVHARAVETAIDRLKELRA